MRSSPLPSVQYRHAAAGQLPRRDAGALAFAQAVRPDQLAGLAVERDDGAPRAAGGVQHAVDRERRAFELVFGPRTEDVGLEPPRDFELAEVAGVDLIERRVLRALDVRVVIRQSPLVVEGGPGPAGTDPGRRGRRKPQRGRLSRPRSHDRRDICLSLAEPVRAAGTGAAGGKLARKLGMRE